MKLKVLLFCLQQRIRKSYLDGYIKLLFFLSFKHTLKYKNTLPYARNIEGHSIAYIYFSIKCSTNSMYYDSNIYVRRCLSYIAIFHLELEKLLVKIFVE